jgi:two-component system, sensor histidine kinase and response regulator
LNSPAEHELARAHFCSRLAFHLGWFQSALGFVVLLGWMFGLPILKSVVPGLVAMNPLSAVCFILCGIALVCFRQNPSGLRRLIFNGCAMTVLGLGIIKVGNYADVLEFRPDRILFSSQLGENQIAPNTVLAFILSGAALLLLPYRVIAAHVVSIAVTLIAWIALLGYLYANVEMYRFMSYIPMALHTAIGFLITGLAIIFARPDGGVLPLVLSSSAGGLLARRLLPACLIVPSFLGWLELQGQNHGLFDEAFGTVLFAASDVFVFVILIYWSAYSMRRAEHKREEAEQKLHAERARVSSLVDSAEDAIISKDLNGLITSWNPGAERLFGYTADEILGKEGVMLFPKEKAEEEPKLIEKIKKGERIDRLETRRVRKDGIEIDVSINLSPIMNANGEVAGISKIAHDITGRKAAEREKAAAALELAKARDAAVQSARAKSEFLANMSHEIRTPMNGVIGMASLLEETSLESDQRRMVETIRMSGDALLTIINDVLDFSKIEAGMLNVEKIEVELDKLLESVTELQGPRAQAKKLELLQYSEPDVPKLVLGDPVRIGQILTNLVGNAIKFTHEGEVVIRLSKRQDSSKGGFLLRFEVSDTGIGMSEKEQAQLFQAFSQADTSTTRKYGGTGLGLAICRRLVEIMEGSIGVKSMPGRGSIFWFELPLVEVPGKKLSSKKTPLSSMNGLRVLIVDDNATNREILERQIIQYGLAAESASSGHQGIEKLNHALCSGKPFQIVLLDMQMPEMDGVGFTRTVRADPRYNDLKMVIMSSIANRLSRNDTRELGLSAFLTKPVKPSCLFDCLVEVTSHEEAIRSQVHSANPVKTDRKSTAVMNNDLKILLVEDNEVNQDVLLRHLNALGYEAKVVGNGIDALKVMEEERFDLVFMDCQMPELDGYETTRQIRRQEEGVSRHTYVVAMTAHALEGDDRKCFQAGMDDYLSKPVNRKKLEGILQKARELAAHSVASKAPLSPSGIGNEVANGNEKSNRVPPIDLDCLRDASDGTSQGMKDLCELYYKQADKLLAAMEDSITTGRAEELQHAAHKLLGSSAICGMECMVTHLRNLEAKGASRKLDGAEEELTVLRAEYARLREYLKAKI